MVIVSLLLFNLLIVSYLTNCNTETVYQFNNLSKFIRVISCGKHSPSAKIEYESTLFSLRVIGKDFNVFC